VAQYPVLLPGTPVTLANAGAPHATLVALIAIFIAAALLVGPSFALLFSMQSRRLLGTGEQGALSAAVAVGHTGQPPAAHHHQRPSADRHRGPATRSAVLGTIVIAAVIRRLRHR
jgi:hypothetical protein